MITLKRTNSSCLEFIALVRHLDAYLAEVDGDEHAFYAQYNKVDSIRHVVVAYVNNTALGCGAIKEFSPDTMEVKRMYTSPEGRKKGIAAAVLNELETWAGEMGYKRCILETGIRQGPAISLYRKLGYCLTESYGQYANVENSVCFEKNL